MKLTRATIAGVFFIGASVAFTSCGGQPDGEGDDHATQNETIDMGATEDVEQDTITTTGDTTTTM